MTMDGSREYDIFVRQQPKQARMCGVGADRRPIDPPPIVQLRVIDKARKNLPSPSPSPPPQHHQQPQPSHPHAHTHESSGPLDTSMLTPAGFGGGPFLQNPYYFMFASLAKPDDDTELHWMKDGKTRCTTGSVVSSLYHLKDSENDNRDAGFFVFPDLSVRQEGSYRLKLSLFEVVGSNVYHCKSIFSSPFYVYTAKKFPGMEESTPLSCSLADQGIKIRIRKDIRQRKPRSGITNFPIPNGQPLGPGVPIQDEESDRDSEARHDDHNDTTDNHNSLSNITSKPANGRKRPEREAEKDHERDTKRPRVDEDEGEPAPNSAPSTGEWAVDPPLPPAASSSTSYDHGRSTASVPPPPPTAPGYPLPPPPQHGTYDPPLPPPQHHTQPAHHTTHPPQHQPPHHYSAPPPQSVPTHPTHPPPPPPYHTQYPSAWPPQHPQHPPPHPHQYDHYSQHYAAQYPPPPRYASAGYDHYAPPPPQQQSVPAYPAAGYYPPYSRPGEGYQYAPPPPPLPPAPGPEGPNSAGRNPPAYGQYHQPPPPQQPPPPPAQPPQAAAESSNYPPPPAPATPSSAGGRPSTGSTAPAPPPGAGAASMYYNSHAQPAPRGYGTPPPPNAYPPAPYHPQHAPPPAHHASPPAPYPPYQHPTHPPPPHQGTWGTPNYPPAPAPGVYHGQSPNQNGAWENGATSGHSSVPTRESSSAAPPAANPSAGTGGPGLQLAPLRGPHDRGEHERDPRTDLKDDRERRKDDRETWAGRGHGLGGGPPSSLAAVSRPDRGRKRLSIGSMLD